MSDAQTCKCGHDIEKHVGRCLADTSWYNMVKGRTIPASCDCQSYRPAAALPGGTP